MIIDRVKPLASIFGCATVVAAALLVTALPAAVQADTLIKCTPTKVTVNDKVAFLSTSSTTGEIIMSFVFTQGGSATSCAIVVFYVTAAADSGDTMEVNVSLDGHTFGLPAAVTMVKDSPPVATAASFTFPDVAPGTHRVRVNYRSTNGVGVSVTAPRAIVHHR